MTPPKAPDAVFRALADPSRRRILDLIKARPGMPVGELGEHFEFSRFAVMKHLRILERVGLIVPRRVGRTKQLYVNAVPIQTIYDRWISRYSAVWASRLTTLKYELEGEEDRKMQATQLQYVQVVYIRTTPQKLWEAITRPELTRKYFHHTDFTSDLRVGSSVEYLLPEKDGKREAAIRGTILEVEPPRRLVHTFSFPSHQDEPTRVTYQLEPMGEVVKLTLTHEGFDGETKTYKGITQGWAPILDSLKSLMETGKPLELPE
jgi:uncharacterized protein YndB with AHSA1/START domain